MSVVRSDIYNGRSVSFVPLTKLDRDVIKGRRATTRSSSSEICLLVSGRPAEETVVEPEQHDLSLLRDIDGHS